MVSVTPKLSNYCLFVLTCLTTVVLLAPEIFANTSLPGTPPRIEAAGSLLKLIDLAVFTWIARLLAGICVLSSGWSLKEQRYGVAVVCLLGAIVIGTAPAWVKNIFAAGGGGVLSSTRIEEIYHV